MVAAITLCAASLVAVCIAFLQLPLISMSVDKCICVQEQAVSFGHMVHAILTC